jgi:hypothetical protein
MIPPITPGPWFVEGERSYLPKSASDKPDYVASVYPVCVKFRGDICRIQSSENIGGISMDESYANARLIAAAPELYAAAEKALYFMRLYKYASQDVADDLEAALKKARGEI